jgi:signal transduction histidine kinase
MLERERDNRLLNAQAVTAAIAHEIRQPLTAIVTNAETALRWLGRTPPTISDDGDDLNRAPDFCNTKILSKLNHRQQFRIS